MAEPWGPCVDGMPWACSEPTGTAWGMQARPLPTRTTPCTAAVTRNSGPPFSLGGRLPVRFGRRWAHERRAAPLLAFSFPHRDGAAAAPQPGTAVGYGRRSCFPRAVFHTWRGGSVPPLRDHSPVGGDRLSWGPKPSSAVRLAGAPGGRLPSRAAPLSQLLAGLPSSSAGHRLVLLGFHSPSPWFPCPERGLLPWGPLRSSVLLCCPLFTVWVTVRPFIGNPLR